MSAYCECCVWSGRILCDGLISRPEEVLRNVTYLAGFYFETSRPTSAGEPLKKKYFYMFEF